VLNKVRDLNLVLIAVQTVGPDGDSCAGTNQ
jgi:hypothetical protein